MESADAVLEGFVELGEAANNKVQDGVDVGIGLLLGVDDVVLLVGGFLSDAEQVVDCIVEDLGDFLRDELFLNHEQVTSPPSSISYINTNQITHHYP